MLNNRASTRPKAHGGPLVPAVTKCKEYAASGAEWRCTLTSPNSCAAGDGRRVVVTGEGASKTAASELVDLRAVASLINESPSEFLLRPAHWKVPPDELVANLPRADPASGGHHQPALPVHTAPARLRGAGSGADAPDADARLAAHVRDCLKTHGGEFDPPHISHYKMWWSGKSDEREHEKFNELLARGGLKPFLDNNRHSDDEFAWFPKNAGKGMVITWASWARQRAVDDVPAVGAAPQQEGDALPLACPEPPPSGDGQDESNPWDELR